MKASPPAPCTPPHPTPTDCHTPGPPGPPSQCCKIPVGVVGWKGASSPPPPTLPQASEGTMGWRGLHRRCQGNKSQDWLRACVPSVPQPVNPGHPRQPIAGRPLSPLQLSLGCSKVGMVYLDRTPSWPLSISPISRPGLASEKNFHGA